MPVFLAQTFRQQYFFSVCTQCALCCPLNSSLLWRSPQMDLIVVIKIRVSQHSCSLTPLAPFLYILSNLCHFSSPPSSILVTRPPSSSLLHSSSILLSSSSSSSPCAPAPSLTQGPCVPVCNISKAVRQPGQGKQPSAGFRGDGGPRCFSSGTQGPPKASGWGQGGAEGEDNPLSCPPQEHTPAGLFFSFFSISIFSLLPFVSLLLTTRSLWFFLFLYLCTQTFNIISLRHVQSFTTTFMYSYTYTFLPILFLCWHERDAFQYASYMQSMGDIEIINSILCPNTCHTHRLLLEVFGKPIMTLQEERSEKVEGEKEKRQQKTRRKRKM